MAAPTITWRSLANGANFGNTAADFEGINDTLSGAMQNFKQAGQSIGNDRQAVYDNGQANMQEQFQTLLANNKHEQARNFLTEGGGGFDLRNKSSLIPTIDADIKSDLKKTRADSLATYNFSEAERNQREAPILAAARSRIQNGTATLNGLYGLDIQDTSGLTKSFNDKLRSDKDYAYGQDQIRQSEVGAQGAISLGQTAQNEGDLTRIQNKYIKDNNLKGRHATEFKAATDAAYKRADTLTTEANNEITDRASQYASSVSSLASQRDFIKQQTIPAVLPEEVESYSSDYAKSDAVKYIGELSGESSWATLDTPTPLNSGVEGKDNGITYTEKGIKEVEEKLLADIAKSLPTADGKITSTSQLHENFKRDGIPGIVVKRAFDRTAREGSEESKGGEWEYEQFTNLLKEEFDAYAAYKDKIFKSQEFDKETETQLSKLTKQNADNLRKFEKQHRGFQKFTNQPK